MQWRLSSCTNTFRHHLLFLLLLLPPPLLLLAASCYRYLIVGRRLDVALLGKPTGIN